MQKFIRFCAALVLSLVFPALAFAYYSPNTVTTPYWCGSYWSSLPCTSGWNMNMQYGNYQYQNYPQYTQPYSYYPYQQYSYYNNYQYQNNYQNGYWGYCYQTVAPGYGYSYRYPCFYKYQQYQYYNYNPYQYNYYNSTQPYYYPGMSW